MKDRTILALKGLAIIGVVLYHVSNRRFDPEVSSWIHGTVIAFSWCVLGFFCVSGYLHALSDSRKSKSIVEFTRARVQRLLVPFVILVFVYSCIWQLVQALHVPSLGETVPPGFLGKLEEGLWPLDSRVAQQLYFFPLLFGISVVLVVVQKWFGLRGMWAAVAIGAGVGVDFFPRAFTGFSWAVFLWGVAFYAAGYLLFHYRNERARVRLALLVATVLLAISDGGNGLLRCVPLWLLSEGRAIGFDRAPLLLAVLCHLREIVIEREVDHRVGCRRRVGKPAEIVERPTQHLGALGGEPRGRLSGARKTEHLVSATQKLVQHHVAHPTGRAGYEYTHCNTPLRSRALLVRAVLR